MIEPFDADSLYQSIVNHFYATSAEKDEARLIFNTLNKLDQQDKRVSSLHKSLLNIKIRLERRELNPEGLQKEIELYGTNLDHFEDSLLSSTEAGRASQKSILKYLYFLILFVLLTICVCISLVVYNPPTEAIPLGTIVFSLGIGCIVLFLLLRSSQNAREACERMDEKIVAIQFLRNALNYLINNPQNEILVQEGVKMFLGHHAVKSKPLGEKDFELILSYLSKAHKKTDCDASDPLK